MGTYFKGPKVYFLTEAVLTLQKLSSVFLYVLLSVFKFWDSLCVLLRVTVMLGPPISLC